MAGNVTVIGRAARVRGRISGDADVEILGFVDGEIAVGGDVTVEAGGMVGAGVQGRRLIVRGAVKGNLIGQQAVVLEDGARVVGDVRAPRIAIAEGALVRGYVQTADEDATAAPAARVQAAARPVASGAKAATALPRTVSQSPAKPPAASSTKTSTAHHETSSSRGASGSSSAGTSSGPRRPPPPVVPALKKLKGQMLKKKER